MPNTYTNKVQLADGTTILDISSDTVTAADVFVGATFHLKSGEPTTGTLASGDNTEYGITDGTIPKVGIAKVGSAEL